MRTNHRRRVSAGAIAVFLGVSVALGSGLTAPARAADTTAVSAVILGVGANEAQRIVTWYTSADTAQQVQLAPTAELGAGGEFPAGAVTFAATGTANIASSGGYNRHATLTGLRENTSYTYRVGAEGGWSAAYTFRTRDFEGDYDFLFYGDPQIGASGNLAKDQAGWVDTLEVSLAANPDAELLVSGGDQVENANTESQWNAFLASDRLRQYPWAATIGNHDVGGKAYEQHLYTPNTDRSAAYYADGKGVTTSGGDYWYIYKDTLFIDLNSNSYAASQGGGGDAAHVAYVTDVIDRHGAEAKWTVLVYHHSIYSAAAHAKDADNKVRRVDFPTTFSKLGVDLVLQGHDHVYTRSYLIKNGAKADPAEQPGQSDVFAGPGGVLYVTANSASGSKYYDISRPDSSGTSGAGNGADPRKPENYWYNSVQNQEHVRSYVKVQVRNDKLVVENVRSGTCAAPNASVELGSSCGNDAATQGVGTIVDRVTVHPYHGDGQDIQVNVPALAPGEFGWTVNGQNSLVDLGTATENPNQNYLTAAGRINPIRVTDSRRTLSPWSLSAGVGDFTDAGKSFSGSYLGWSPYLVTRGAGAVAGDPVPSGYVDGGKGLAQPSVLGSAAQGHARGSAVLGAGLDLRVPDSVDKGNYRTTLTITALSS
ncbi:purple acid phosphatase family protein [Actinoplanes teichomyceticus]|uniref:3',5'-cyclic AMP phosphodiesterase CpdA n=1 Tax=Actinoplanes teichomyceticus TaxID=1867 RepID=A0A561VS74_ACTTI|nr:metallophosphoesterase family protein [Actinoplanes teichomyceticus]TWG14440.1 3',5'-cyclic AMP phosphodiesterase CpdA [Actinoplanes teichomyceticus]GIF16241.1 hypothetical protein Ate01nite_62730 [Actinoplanes teichomyceticus]